MNNLFFWKCALYKFYNSTFNEGEPVILFISEGMLVEIFNNADCQWLNNQPRPEWNEAAIINSYKNTWLSFLNNNIENRNDNRNLDLKQLLFIVSGFVLGADQSANYWSENGTLAGKYNRKFQYDRYSYAIEVWLDALTLSLSNNGYELFSTRIYNRGNDRLGRIKCHRILNVGDENIAKAIIELGIELKAEYSREDIENITNKAKIIKSSADAIIKLSEENLGVATYFINKAIKGIDFEEIRAKNQKNNNVAQLSYIEYLEYAQEKKCFVKKQGIEIRQEDLSKIFGNNTSIEFKCGDYSFFLYKTIYFEYTHFGKSLIILRFSSVCEANEYNSSDGKFIIKINSPEEILRIFFCQLLKYEPPRFRIFSGKSIKMDSNGFVFSEKEISAGDSLMKRNKVYIDNKEYFVHKVKNDYEIDGINVSVKQSGIEIEYEGIGDGQKGKTSFDSSFPLKITVSGTEEFDRVIIQSTVDNICIAEELITNDKFFAEIILNLKVGSYEVIIFKGENKVNTNNRHIFEITAETDIGLEGLLEKYLEDCPDNFVKTNCRVLSNPSEVVELDIVQDLVDTLIRLGYDKSAYGKFSKILEAILKVKGIPYENIDFANLRREILILLDQTGVFDVDFKDLSMSKIKRPMWVQTSQGNFLIVGGLLNKQIEELKRLSNINCSVQYKQIILGKDMYRLKSSSFFSNQDVAYNKLPSLKDKINKPINEKSAFHKLLNNNNSFFIPICYKDFLPFYDKKIVLDKTHIYLNVNINQTIEKYDWVNIAMKSVSQSDIDVLLSKPGILLFKIKSQLKSITTTYVLLEGEQINDTIDWKYAVYEKKDRNWSKWHLYHRIAKNRSLGESELPLMNNERNNEDIKYQIRINNILLGLIIFNPKTNNFGVPYYIQLPKQISRLLFMCSGYLPQVVDLNGKKYQIFNSIPERVAHFVSIALIGKFNNDKNYTENTNI